MNYDDGLDRVECADCGRWFAPPFWMRRPQCRICYLDRENLTDLAVAELAFEKGYMLGLTRARRQDDVDLDAALGGLPLRDLVSLCHPDRHPPERFDLANRITGWLLALRDTATTTQEDT